MADPDVAAWLKRTQAALERLGHAARTTAGRGVEAVGDGVAAAGDLAERGTDVVAEGTTAAGRLLDRGLDAAGDVADHATEVVDRGMDQAGRAAGAVVERMGDAAGDGIEGVTDLAERGLDYVADKVGGKTGEVLRGVRDHVDATGKAVDQALDGAARQAGELVEQGADRAGDVVESAGDLLDQGLDAAGSATEAVFGAAATGAETAGDAAQGAADVAGDAVHSAGEAIQGGGGDGQATASSDSSTSPSPAGDSAGEAPSGGAGDTQPTVGSDPAGGSTMQIAAEIAKLVGNAGKERSAADQALSRLEEEISTANKIILRGTVVGTSRLLNIVPEAGDVPAPSGSDLQEQFASAMRISGKAEASLAQAESQQEGLEVAADDIQLAQREADTALQEAGTQLGQLGVSVMKTTNWYGVAASKVGQAVSLAGKAEAKAKQAEADGKPAEEVARLKADVAAEKTGLTMCRAHEASIVSIKNQITADMTGTDPKLAAARSERTKLDDAVEGLDELKKKNARRMPQYEANVAQATQQEQECEQALNDPAAAERLREAYYEELGGDAELQRVLEAEDRAFDTDLESQRAAIKDWQADRNRELNALKRDRESSQKTNAETIENHKAFVQRESPLATQYRSRVAALGAKAGTPRGKEATYAVTEQETELANVKKQLADLEEYHRLNGELIKSIDGQIEDVDKKYEGFEKQLAETKTEYDNELEMSVMDLETKILHLEQNPQHIRYRHQSNLEYEKAIILRDMRADLKQEAGALTPPTPGAEMAPLDWAAADQKLKAVEEATLEQLQQDEAKQADLQAAYDAAGGDSALHAKRLKAWQDAQQQRQAVDQAKEKLHRKNQEQLQKQLRDASKQLIDLEAEVAAQEKFVTEQRRLLAGLSPQTSREKREKELMTRQLKRAEAELAVAKSRLDALRQSKQRAEQSLSNERSRHEQVMDDDYGETGSKPTPADLEAIPLAAKYTMLTDKQPPTS